MMLARCMIFAISKCPDLPVHRVTCKCKCIAKTLSQQCVGHTVQTKTTLEVEVLTTGLREIILTHNPAPAYVFGQIQP